MTEVHTVIIGGGLAGLGCAIGLLKENKSVVVLERTRDPFLGEPKELRYDPSMPASYKSAGMIDLYTPLSSIMNHFMKTTNSIYEEAGVPIHHGGLSTIMDQEVVADVADFIFQKEVLKGKELQSMKLIEPHIRLDKVDAVYRLDAASSAFPQEAMQHLMDYVRKLGGSIKFDQELLFMTRVVKKIGIKWKVKTRDLEFFADNIVIAAGPWTKSIVKAHFSRTLPITSVLGIIAEIVPPPEAPKPYFNGLIMSARSTIQWGVMDAEDYLIGRSALEVTRYQNRKKTIATHMYMSIQQGNIFLGGPRIALNDNYKEEDLDPALYKKDMQETIDYVNRIVEMPQNSEKGRWSGVMAFTADELPILGPLEDSTLHGIYICTGFASSGFRAGPGGGAWLGKCIALNDGNPLVDETGVSAERVAKVNPGRFRKGLNKCSIA